ncbi:ankyrin repeat domain-containing protein [Paenibacillus koleovorans]|uniref:ankyrin repeat domain-containing protein n=1 Tax=Paenibacillus koleovorans TaxID=121608 RepID=UPI000FDB1509|nr:ankyrin repeat domain-containing protein [Paenibacillus koleovorans]
METFNELFHRAVAAMDAGDAAGLKIMLETHPELIKKRLIEGKGYFRDPYLLWFVAENPIRLGRLPVNIVEVTDVILRAIEHEAVESRQVQLDYALLLAASGCVARQCGVQLALLDTLLEAGADAQGALLPALAHRELEAAERLLLRGAALTLTAAVCTRRYGDIERLACLAAPEERQTALTAAAMYSAGDTLALALLLRRGDVALDAYSPAGFHAHATPLHQAVAAGSLEAVRLLVDAGASLAIRDHIYGGTPLGWAEHLQHAEIAALLRGRM